MQGKAFFLFALLATPLSAQETEELTTAFPLHQVLVGEQALLNIQIIGEQPNGPLAADETTTLEFETLQPDVLSRRIFCANVGVSSKEAGQFKIPSFQVPLESGEQKTDPFTLEVFPTDDITWDTLKIGNKTFRVGTILLHPSGPIYAGQSVPLTAKVLLPTDLPVNGAGFAEIDKDNIGAWRLESPLPPNYNQQVNPRPSIASRPREVRVDGRRYQVINYTTFAAPLGDGPVTVGPGTIQGLQVQVRNEERSRGFFSSFSRSYNLELEVPKISFSALPLPAGAPAGFEGAVGNFTLEAALDITNELKPGDPVLVDLTVRGKGNLDTLAAPRIEAPESNWKLYPASRNEKEGSRRTNQGAVSFSQILRPLVPITEVPPFTLAFFNPQSGKYETLRSESMPLNLAPASTISNGVPQAGLVPIAEMQDILGLIEPQSFRARKSFRLGWWWQIPFLLAVVALFSLIVKRHLPHWRPQDPEKEALQQEMKALEGLTEPEAFLRSAANLAESRELKEDSFLTELLAERDEHCFRPGETHAELPTSRRKEILAGLRERISLLITAFIFFLAWQAPPLEAADSFHTEAQAAWEDEKYEDALAAYQLALKEKTTPDLLYNIGNCYYRLDQIGEAALHYHRALRLDPKHPEARQNLAFLNRKVGAIPEFESTQPLWAQKTSVSFLNGLLLFFFWIGLIALLIRFVRPTSTIQKASTIAIITTIALAFLIGIVRFFHPAQDDLLLPANAILVGEKTQAVRTEPSTAGSKILEANPAESFRVLTQRGDWSYVELRNATRGWIKSAALKEI